MERRKWGCAGQGGTEGSGVAQQGCAGAEGSRTARQGCIGTEGSGGAGDAGVLSGASSRAEHTFLQTFEVCVCSFGILAFLSLRLVSLSSLTCVPSDPAILCCWKHRSEVERRGDARRCRISHYFHKFLLMLVLFLLRCELAFGNFFP